MKVMCHYLSFWLGHKPILEACFKVLSPDKEKNLQNFLKKVNSMHTWSWEVGDQHVDGIL